MSTVVWSSPAWREQAVHWLDARLRDAGIARTGDVEQPHLRPWATVLRAPTTRGPVWLKAASRGTAAEVGLYELLSRIVPDRVLLPIALDAQRGWLLLPDGGATLGEVRTGDALVDDLERALPYYGQLQRDLAPHAERILALGLADMRPAVMPIRFDEALAAAASYAMTRGTEEDRAAVARITAMRPVYIDWCDKLAVAPGAPTLEHNDLHAFNVFISPAGADYQFYDWGDAVVGHPFASMLVALAFIQDHLKTSEHDARVIRLRDAYLEAFSDLAPHAELVATVEVACRATKVARAVTWLRLLASLDEDPGELADAPLRWLSAVTAASYLGCVS